MAAPEGGIYTVAQAVKLSSATPGSKIYYTVDGSIPTANSTLYVEPILVQVSQQIKAIATGQTITDSIVASFVYAITGTVQAPEFSAAPGAYGSAQTIVIKSATPNAEIYYTTDGSTPTTASTRYKDPIVVTESKTVKAYAVLKNWSDSLVSTGTYSIAIDGQVATPTFAAAAGSYGPPQMVTLISTTPGAQIYYTSDGTTPTASSLKFSSPITVSSSQTIKAIAIKTSFLDSSVASAAYVINGAAATPIFSVAAGAYGPSQTVAISSATTGANIYYTTNGSDPTTSSSVYSAALPVSTTTTIKAIAVKSGFSTSNIALATYTINGKVAAPTFSIATGTYHASQQVTLSGASGADIYYTTNGNTPSRSSTKYTNTPIDIGATTTIKAFLVKPTFIDSDVSSASYTINKITPIAVEAFPAVTNYPLVSWTPNVKFSIASPTTLGLFSNMTGTAVNTPVNATAGTNNFSANTVQSLDSTGTIYAKMPSGPTSAYVNMGTYKTKLPPNFNFSGSVNGSVLTMLKDNKSVGCTTSPGCIIIGGSFTQAGGTSANNIARIKPNGGFETLGTGVNNSVNTLATDSTGNIYAGGAFTAAGGVTVNYIAKYNGTSWSALGTGMNGHVRALAVGTDGNIYAGGEFTTAGGVSANYVSKWNGSVWSALGSGTNGDVYALAADSMGNLYVGGRFGAAGGVAAPSVARWTGSAWDSLGGSSDLSPGGAVYALAWTGAGLYVGGDFIVGNFTFGAKNMARWNGHMTSYRFVGLGSGTNQPVETLIADASGDIYAGGGFTTAGGLSTNYVAKWKPGSTSGSWSALSTGMNGNVKSLVFDDSGTLYAGGSFTTAGAVSATNIAKWDSTSWGALGIRMNGAVNALAFDKSGNMYAGGSFTTAGGVSANYVAKWNGSSWSPLGTGVNGVVYALAIDSAGNIFVGGSFTVAGGKTANNFARWNVASSSWSTIYPGMNGTVYSLVFDASGNLYAGGSFTDAGGINAEHVAKYDGFSWSALDGGIDGTVTTLVFDKNGTLYAGESQGTNAGKVSYWNGVLWSSVGSGMNGGVERLVFDGSGNLYAGGNFTEITSEPALPANYVAKWNGSSWSGLGPQSNPGLNGSVRSLAVDSSGNLFAGGAFTLAYTSNENPPATVSVPRVAKWDGSTWSSLGIGVDGVASELAFDGDGNLYVAGEFGNAGDLVRPYIAKWITKFASWF